MLNQMSSKGKNSQAYCLSTPSPAESVCSRKKIFTSLKSQFLSTICPGIYAFFPLGKNRQIFIFCWNIFLQNVYTQHLHVCLIRADKFIWETSYTWYKYAIVSLIQSVQIVQSNCKSSHHSFIHTDTQQTGCDAD